MLWIVHFVASRSIMFTIKVDHDGYFKDKRGKSVYISREVNYVDYYDSDMMDFFVIQKLG